MSFSGKVVIVTGASSGIGADAATEFAKEGAKVVLVGRNDARLHTVAEKIKNFGAVAPLTILADVSKDATRIIHQTIQHFGQLDVLVNNAGIGNTDTASTVDLDRFDRVFATNVRGVVELTKLAVPHLENTKGNVVIISSDIGIKPLMQCTSYCMTKAAINMYTKCASLELAPKGIRVNAVNPGLTKTAFMEPLGTEMVNHFYEQHKHEVPVGRNGEVGDITNGILFLANEKSSFINGALLVINGGYSV